MREIGPGYTESPIRARLGECGLGNRVRRIQQKARRPKLENMMQRALATEYVRRLQDVKPLQKLVLFSLACRLDCETQTADVSYTDLAKDCGMSRRSAIRVIAELERKRILLVYHSPGAAHWASTIYRFNLATELTSSSDYQTPEMLWERTKMQSERIREPGNTGVSARKTVLKCWRDEIDELLSYFPDDYGGEVPDAYCNWKIGDNIRQLEEKLSLYGIDIESNPSQCAMLTQSRKYDFRRCTRPATHGLLSGLHHRFRLGKLQARLEKRRREEEEYQKRAAEPADIQL